MSVLQRYQAVRKSVDDVCRDCGRDPESVLLLPVSKTKPEEMILELYQAGIRDFGENYVQELRAKEESLPKDIRWHMIGHLQRNKVKYIAPFVYLIHSVDSVPLAATIEKEAAKCGRVIPILLEVNIGEEESKFGFSPETLRESLPDILALPHVSVKGLMTSAPICEDQEAVRWVFREMRKLSLDTLPENPNNNMEPVLSMGMSGDYRAAIGEGASIVRIGTDIFGARDYSK